MIKSNRCFTSNMVRPTLLDYMFSTKVCADCRENIFVYISDGHIYCEICENYVSELV